jgi:hypothetical protein
MTIIEMITLGINLTLGGICVFFSLKKARQWLFSPVEQSILVGGAAVVCVVTALLLPGTFFSALLTAGWTIAVFGIINTRHFYWYMPIDTSAILTAFGFALVTLAYINSDLPMAYRWFVWVTSLGVIGMGLYFLIPELIKNKKRKRKRRRRR